MVSLSFPRLAVLCVVVSGLRNVLALPSPPFTPGPGIAESDLSNATAPQEHGLVARSTPSAPHFVVYTDSWISGITGPPPVSDVNGFNVVALAFVLTSGAYDKAQEWASLSASERKSIKAKYAAAGIKLVISVFGSTDAPTSSGANAISTANKMAKFVKDYDLDGIDVDYEDFDAMNAGDGRAETWLVAFTKQLRAELPQGQYILTHAPVAPWFSPGKYGGGGYLKVHEKVGSLIDWYNVQFYNQNEYTSCSDLLTKSSSAWPESSVFQIAANGVSLNKLVIGKPGSSGDASNGYMSPVTLAGCLKQAKAKGWTGGVMSWEYPHANAAWIKTVRSESFPE